MLDIDPFLGDQIRVGGLGGLGGMPPPEAPPAPDLPVMSSAKAGEPSEFGEIAARLRADLIKDLGLEPHQASAIVGNLAHETGGFKHFQEIKPLIPGSRGGFGYAQWTGPRRRQFESWAEEQGLDPRSYEANYGFLRHELTNTPEGRVLNSLRRAPDAETATRVFSDQFLRPGIVGMGSRIRWTNRAMGAEDVAPAPMAFAPASGGGDVPPAFARSLGQSQVPVSPMAGRIMASLENPGAGAMPDEPAMARAPRGVQVASLGNRSVPPVGPRPSAAPFPTPVQGQPNMPMEDYTQGPDRGALAFALMNAGMQPVGGGEAIGGLGGLGGMRMPQPSAAPAAAPSGPPQGQQSASPQPQSLDAFLESRIPSVRPNPLAFFGKPALENQMAERERQTAIGMAKAMIAQGVDPNIAASLVGTPEGRAQLVRMQERNDARAFQEKQFAFQVEDKKADNARADKIAEQQGKSQIRRTLEELGYTPDHPEYKARYNQLLTQGKTNEVQQRREDAERLGLSKDDPRYMPFVLTGNMPKETQQTLTAGDKKAIYEAEDALPAIENVIGSLSRAKELNRKTYTGAGSDIRSWIGTALPDAIVPDALASPAKSADTREFGQLMSLEAIKSMAEILKGATTNEEMSRFVSILADPSTPPDIRERTIDRMIGLAQRQKATAVDRIKSLREGDYFKKDRQQPSGTPAPTVPGNTSSAPANAAPTVNAPTATNPQTGERLILRNGKWEPLK